VVWVRRYGLGGIVKDYINPSLMGWYGLGGMGQRVWVKGQEECMYSYVYVFIYTYKYTYKNVARNR
jgi:hypothetical protein